MNIFKIKLVYFNNMDTEFIYNEFSDSDSSTSDVSTVTPDYEIEYLDDIKIKLREELPQYNISLSSFIDINGNEINDTFELSLLLWCQIIFGNNGTINLANIEKYIDNNYGSELYDFYMEYRGIFDDEYYNTSSGYKTRTEWFKLLSNKSFFKYTNNGIESSLDNFFNFIDNFFPKIFTDNIILNKNQDKLNYIYSKLNFNYEDLGVIIIEKHNKIIQTIYINNIDIYEWIIENGKSEIKFKL
jgi:hypothetical protein